MAYPDAAVLVRDWLRANVFPGMGPDRIRVESEMPQNLQHAERLIVATKAPSSPGDTQLSVDVSDVIVDCYARTQDRANAMAEQVRSGVRVRMRLYTTEDGAMVKTVQTLAGPARVPSSSAMRRQNSATYRIFVHAKP